jgi:REP element-mobilizing transposase RayT
MGEGVMKRSAMPAKKTTIPPLPHRHSIRLASYDYSQPGAYFVTLVTHQRQCLFGQIINSKMHYSAMGRVADEHWRAIPDHFPQVELGPYIIMPNHIHGIIIIHPSPVGASQGYAPTTAPTMPNGPKRGSVGAILGAYKMSVTRRTNCDGQHSPIWQRNYYEHILRSEEELQHFIAYIQNNPSRWQSDRENMHPISPISF